MLLPALIRKECLLVLRDRQGLALLFVLPMVFILIMSLAMQGALQLGTGALETVLVEDGDRTAASEAFTEALGAGGRFDFRAVQDREPDGTLAAAVQAGEARIAVRIPEGFAAALAEEPGSDLAGAATPRIYFAPALIPEVRRIFTLTAEGSLQYVRVATALEALSGGSGAPGADVADWLGPDGAGLHEEVVYAGDRAPAVPNAVQHSVPAWLVFSMFFVVAPIAASLIVERDQGTLLRLRQMNVSPLWLLGSRLVPYYAINMLQLVLMLGVGVFLVPLFGGERLGLGSSPVGLWLIGSAVSLAAIGLALLMAVLAGTVIQATLTGGVVCLIIGALGGIMVPKAVMPPTMQAIANLSPMSWGLEGFWEVLLRYGDWRDVLPEAGLLLLFAAVTWCLASALFGRQGH